MATRPDKQKVIDEIWDDDRVRSFLAPPPADPDVDRDWFVLSRAYQSMRVGDFRRLLTMFLAQGGNLDARDARGATLAEGIATHRHAGPFIEALIAAGATPPARRAEQ
ncbi:MAG TPA: PA4642 family protein [Pseudomonadales bacterium]|nr:PA4642 family protein [Pseudomonadales bacterium]